MNLLLNLPVSAPAVMKICDPRIEFHSTLPTEMFSAELGDLILHRLKIKLTESPNIKKIFSTMKLIFSFDIILRVMFAYIYVY